MTDMTPEQLDALDQWRAEQAMECRILRYSYSANDMLETAKTAARLAREDVRPVNPDVLAVREMCAQAIVDEQGDVSWAKDYRNGLYDKSFTVTVALAAYRAGREAGR